jgi:hypothetical protein
MIAADIPQTFDNLERDYFRNTISIAKVSCASKDEVWKDNSILNSKYPVQIKNNDIFEEEIIHYLKESKIHNKAISLRKKFDSLYSLKSNFLKGIDYETIEFCVLAIISNIVECDPHGVSIEITEDKSILFTAKCTDFNLYIDLFFENEIDDYAETVINIYKDKKNIYSFGGNFSDTIKDFKQNFIQKGQQA